MRARAPLLVAIVGFVLVVGVAFFYVLPKVRAVDEARGQLEEAEQQEVGLRAELARLQEARDAAAEVRRELARIRRAVPPVADVPGLINSLQDAADASDVEFFSFSPGEPLPTIGAQAAKLPAEIRVNGGFFAVDEFLFRVETLARAAKVITIAISTLAVTEEGTTVEPTTDVATIGDLQVQLTVEFYTKDVTAGPGAAVAPPEASPEATPSPGTESPSPGATTSPSPTTEGT